jgi:hypothetical protein
MPFARTLEHPSKGVEQDLHTAEQTGDSVNVSRDQFVVANDSSRVATLWRYGLSTSQ